MLNVENQKMPVSAIIEEVLKINRLVEGGGSWCFTMVCRMSHCLMRGDQKHSLTTSGGGGT